MLTAESTQSQSRDASSGTTASETAFRRRLVALVVLAALVRIVFSLMVASDLPFGVDADFYRLTATSLSTGNGFTYRPAETMASIGDENLRVPATSHGPVHSVVLAGADVVHVRSLDQHRIVLSLVSALGVACTGLLGRRVGGRRVGLIAAAIAAFHPLWFQAAGFLSSEATYFLVLPAALLVAHIAMHEQRWAWWVAAGAMAAVAALTRSEAVLLIAMVTITMAWTARSGHRIRAGVAVALTAAVLLAPWVLWVHARTGATTMSTNSGITLAGSNCDAAYYGPRLGTFGGTCAFAMAAMAGGPMPPGLDDGHQLGIRNARTTALGIDYMRAHRSRLPIVATARGLRTWGLFRIDNSLEFDTSIGAHRPTQHVGYVINWTLLPLALVGVVVLTWRRQWAHLSVLLVGVVLATATGVLIYGATRMRIPAEPVLAILAALAVVGALDRIRHRGHEGHVKERSGWSRFRHDRASSSHG